MTDPLDACQERWRGTIPLTDTHLREALRRDCGPDGVSMLVAEILRLREEIEWLDMDRRQLKECWEATLDIAGERQTEIERLHALVTAGHTHRWAPQSDTRTVCATCGIWWRDPWPAEEADHG